MTICGQATMKLYMENQQLSLQVQSAEEAMAENERLRVLLDAQDRYEALDPIYAASSRADPGEWFDTFSVNPRHQRRRQRGHGRRHRPTGWWAAFTRRA